MNRKPKQKYGPEYPAQHYAEKMALEVGDSLNTFIEVVHREFTALKLKGIHFSHIHIGITTDNRAIAPSSVSITIYSDLTGKLQTQYGEKEEDSRLFIVGGRHWVEDAFHLIYHWRNELVTFHQMHLKPAEQANLFTPQK